MSTELMTPQKPISGEMALESKGQTAPATVYEVLGELARDPSMDPARLVALFDLQIKAEDRHAEKEFNAAFARLQPKLPRITKRGVIEMGAKGSMKFARYEDLDAAIKPLYTAEGFSLSFLSKATDKGILLVAVLKHAAGHSEPSEMQLPPDAGAGRNALQALGSSLSYAKRYLTCNVFNIVTENEDDDGNKISQISKQQIESIEDLMHECSLSPEARTKLLEMFGIKVLSDATKALYPAIINMLVAKRNALGSKAK